MREIQVMKRMRVEVGESGRGDESAGGEDSGHETDASGSPQSEPVGGDGHPHSPVAEVQGVERCTEEVQERPDTRYLSVLERFHQGGGDRQGGRGGSVLERILSIHCSQRSPPCECPSFKRRAEGGPSYRGQGKRLKEVL